MKKMIAAWIQNKEVRQSTYLFCSGTGGGEKITSSVAKTGR